ncbi:MAG TPA: phosphoribosylformylglycinamidine synthase I [Verrucomicrobiota bacterium]|nr:phosphoribosylformylglycinamidine synthase I [Verrucomicrobiota bacterium]
MQFAVIQFPASNCDQDAIYAIRLLGHNADFVWHKDNSLNGADVVIIPGGFSYGDYLRTGAIARFSPIMQTVREFAENGGIVIGICNGFQILCEAGLLPGALIRNRSLQFRCEHVFLKTSTFNSPFTCKIPQDKLLKIPVAHGEGCYYASPETIQELQTNDQILFQYCDKDGNLTEQSSPNGSLLNIAGICNKNRNICGMMPHPERACELILNSEDGNLIFQSIIHTLSKTAEKTEIKS